MEHDKRGYAQRSDVGGSPAAHEGRREFVKRIAYVAPVMLTLPVSPALARTGSRPPPPTCNPGETPYWDPTYGWSCSS
jgi:hypothetical protein